MEANECAGEEGGLDCGEGEYQDERGLNIASGLCEAFLQAYFKRKYKLVLGLDMVDKIDLYTS